MKFKTFLLQFLLWGAVVSATCVGALWGIDLYTHHDTTITVPNLKGLSQEAAALKMERLGLQVEVSDTGFVRTLAAGTVLQQSIAAGEKVKPGRLVYITINSSNSPTIVLPDIGDNCSLREAQSRLRSIGFRLGPVEYIDGDQDWVYDVKVRGRVVPAGTRVSVDDPVTLVVGNGKIDDSYNAIDTLMYSFDGMPDSLSGGDYDYDLPEDAGMPAAE